MAKVTATINVQSKQVAAGPAQAGLLVSLIASSGSVFGTPQTITSASLVAEFDNVTPDTYIVTAQPIDTTGALIDVVLKSDAFSIDPAPATMTIYAPISISVTQA